MAQTPKQDAQVAKQTVTFEIPDDPEAARTLMILAAGPADATAMLSGMATEYRTLADKASDLRASHDSLLGLRKSMRGDLADVKPLRAPRGSKTDDETSTDEAATDETKADETPQA